LGEVFFIAKPYGLGWAAVPFSVIAVVGTINAFNMSDGHDGLAGSFLLIVFGALTILSALSGSNYAGPLAVITVTLIPFLLFNLMSVVGRERQVFLGDAGSMSLGLLAAFFLIELSKAGTDVVKVTAAPWLIGLPLLDMVGVMVFRIKRKRSPFQSDRSHLHHLLVGIGWSKYRVLFVLVMVQLGFALVGVIGTFGNWNDGILMWGSFGMLLLYLGLVSRIRGHLGEG
jgi:UDP-GlcNAc:undecaprenyl-phosphate GlcNAc-1-phosphate transferase